MTHDEITKGSIYKVREDCVEECGLFEDAYKNQGAKLIKIRNIQQDGELLFDILDKNGVSIDYCDCFEPGDLEPHTFSVYELPVFEESL